MLSESRNRRLDARWPEVVLIDALSEADVPPPVSDAHSEHAAYVIYTSGSTGKPKGVMRAAPRGRSTSSPAWRASPASRADDRLLAVTTLSFDIAVLELLLPLTVGAQVVIASRETARSTATRCAHCSTAAARP